MKRTIFAAVLGISVLALAAPAAAQSGYRYGRPSYGDSRAPYYEARRAAYDNGYREGLKHGEKDGRRGASFEYGHERTYQQADKGYQRRYGSFDVYRQSFRTGYVDGYSQAYRRHARYDDHGHSSGNRPGSYGRPGYGGYGGSGGYGGYGYNAAFQYGVNDGYEKGVEDARKRRSFDVLRHGWYRSGDRHYDSRHGSRQQYADMYREGFRSGYERGYSEGRWR